MSYTPSTDFPAVLRSTSAGVALGRVPGIDLIIGALGRAGFINLYVGQTAPLSSQATTVWVQPSTLPWTTESVVFLWNPALLTYQVATPALWSLLLSGAAPSNAIPLQDATPGLVGVSLAFARADHVHPTDTSRAPVTSPTFLISAQAPTPAVGDNSTNVATSAFVQETVNIAMPIGGIMAFAGAVAPTNYAICTGQAVSRTTYATLFGVLGVTYGAGDGLTTFNLPDLRGRVVAGVDGGANRLTTATMSSQALAGVGGVEANTLLQSDLPNVTPTFTGTPGTATSTNNNIPVNAATETAGVASGENVITATIIGNLSSTFTPAGSISSINSGAQTHPTNVQPTMELNYIIRIQ